MKTSPRLIALLTLTLVSPLWAGSQVKAHLENLAYPDARLEVTASLGKGRVRLDLTGPKVHGSLIYDQASSWLIWVDDLQKTVLPISPAEQSTLKLAGSFASGKIMAEVEKGGKESQTLFLMVKQDARSLCNGVPRLRERKVQKAGFPCDRYETELETGKARDVWMVDPKLAGLPGEDYQLFLEMTDLVLDLFGGELFEMGADAAVFRRHFSSSRLPVFAVLYAAGKVSSRFQLRSVDAWTAPAGAFSVPKGYRRLSLMKLIQGGTGTKG